MKTRMIGRANISISNVDDVENEKVTLSYFVTDCGDADSAEEIKAKMDQVAESFGADVNKKTVKAK